MERGLLAGMDAALADWGSDGGGLTVDGQVGLGCRLLHITAEDVGEQQPLRHGDCLLVAHVRLDNRADLCRDLGLADRSGLPDSALVMAAYRRHGLDCVEHLQGDWVFALWDRTLRRLMLARCATGTASLFWHRRAGGLAFATGIKALLAHSDGAPALNPERIACLVMGIEDAEEDATVYRDIRLLAPGHLLIASPGGIEMRRWWRPEDLAPLLLPGPDDYYQAFRELYALVVDQHLRIGAGGIAAAVSGGLDSGSVVALAAPRLAEPLKAFVHVPALESVDCARLIGDELPQAVRLAAHVGNVEIVPLRSADAMIMDGIARAQRVQGMPTHAATHEYWLADMLRNARAGGARVLLTGQGGNATVSHTGSGSLLPMLLSGQLPRVLAALHGDESGWLRAVRRRLVAPLAQAAQARRGREVDGPSILNPAFLQALEFSPFAARPFDRRSAFRLGLAGAGRGRAYWMAAGAVHGLDVRDPTRDRRIVEFCWRLPDAVFWANGRQRGLIRRGMAGHLPAEIRDETRKGLQSSDLLARVRMQSAEIDGALDHIAGSAIACGYLDMAAMRRIFAHAVAGGNSMKNLVEAQVLVRGLSVGHFLASRIR